MKAPTSSKLSEGQRIALLERLRKKDYKSLVQLGKDFGVSYQAVQMYKRKLEGNRDKMVTESKRLTLGKINGCISALVDKATEDAMKLAGLKEGTSRQFDIKTTVELINSLVNVRASLIDKGVENEEVDMDYEMAVEAKIASMTPEERSAYIRMLKERRGELGQV